MEHPVDQLPIVRKLNSKWIPEKGIFCPDLFRRPSFPCEHRRNHFVADQSIQQYFELYEEKNMKKSE